MEYSYRFRLYPNATQQVQIAKTFGSCRFVYNHFLHERQTAYRDSGISVSRFQQEKDFPQ